MRPLTWIVFGVGTLLALVCNVSLGSGVPVGFAIGIFMTIGAVEAEGILS